MTEKTKREIRMSSNAQKTHATKNGDGALKVATSPFFLVFSVILFPMRSSRTLPGSRGDDAGQYAQGLAVRCSDFLLLYAVVRGLIREAVEYSEREEVAAREREHTALLLRSDYGRLPAMPSSPRIALAAPISISKRVG